MKVLIAVLSCELFRTNGNNQAVRDTWLPLVKGADCRIFMGQGSKVSQNDEVFLDVPDDYSHVTYKTRAIYKWASEENYDYIFKCYPDTYVCPSRLMLSGFEKYDYSGNFACKPLSGAYCCGGTGYWLSKKAYTPLIDAKVYEEDTIVFGGTKHSPLSRAVRRPPRPPIVLKNIDTWAEDKWTGDFIKHNGLYSKHHDKRYEDDVMASGPQIGNTKITQHLSRPIQEGEHSYYENQWMLNKHREWLDSLSRIESKIKKVAVITPTVLDRHLLLQECKDSVSAQTWGGSVYHAIGEDTKKEGAAITRNRIVRNVDSEYEWLAFVDDDDIIYPNHLSTLIEGSEDADIIYSDCEEEGFIKTWKTREFNYAEVKAENYIPVTVLMRRSVFDKIGGFPLDHFPGEDQWMFLNAASAGAKFKYIPKTTWMYRKHPQHRCLSL
jgi:hypothetical protein